MLQIHTQDSYAINSDKWIWANSLDTSTWKHFVKKTWSIVDKAWASDRIVWVNYTEKLFASNNETAWKDIVQFEPKKTDIIYQVTIAGWTITVDDESKFYNLSNSNTVDWTTESLVPYFVNTSDAGAAVDTVVSMQLELIKYISATEGTFRIINL